MMDIYTNSEYGPCFQQAFNASSGATVRVLITLPASAREALFVLRPTKNMRIRKGGSTIDLGATINGKTDVGCLLRANEAWPLRINSSDPANNYIVIRGASTDAGTLEISLNSSLENWTLA